MTLRIAAALAAHPLEVVFGNVIGVMLGPFLLRTHLYVVLIGTVIGTAATMYDHCGYWLVGDSALSVQPFFHDWHHEKNSGNFGFLGLMDWLLGTDQSECARVCVRIVFVVDVSVCVLLDWRREFKARRLDVLKRAAKMKTT